MGPSPQRDGDTVAKPLSIAAIWRRKLLLPICAGLFGVLVMPALYFLDRNDQINRAPIMAVVASILGFLLYGTGRRILACFLTLPIGAVLFAKPFVRPVMYEGMPSSLHSETHYYFLISGGLVVIVFSLMSLDAFARRNSPSTDGRVLRVAAAVLFVLGVAAGYLAFGGPTVADVLKQYEPQGAAMRKQFFMFAKSLPEVGKVEPLEVKLVPQPIWREGQSIENNIEIVTTDELWNPEETPKSRNLYLSDELAHAVRWTGPKNPMSSDSMSERAGDFEKRMTHAFGLPFIAAYRPGFNGLEVFVFDLHAQRIVAATIATGTTGDFSRDRKVVVEALSRATGGTFSLK